MSSWDRAAKFGNRVLLIYGGNSIKNSGLYDKIINELDKADMTVFELAGVEPNPRHTTYTPNNQAVNINTPSAFRQRVKSTITVLR